MNLIDRLPKIFRPDPHCPTRTPLSCCCASLLIVTCLIAGCGSGDARLTPLPPNAVIVAFGDSLTEGTPHLAPNATYPARLQSLTGLSVVNAGVRGETSAQGVRRLPGVLQRYAPNLVILCHGGNDLLRRLPPQALRDNLKTMIEACREYGAQVLLVAVPKPGLLATPAPLYEDVAKETRVPLEREVIARILADGALKSDLVHPNSKGNAVLASTLAESLKAFGALSASP